MTLRKSGSGAGTATGFGEPRQSVNDNGEVLSELQHAGPPVEVGRAVANDGKGFGVARQGYVVLAQNASSQRHRACGDKDGDMESRV